MQEWNEHCVGLCRIGLRTICGHALSPWDPPVLTSTKHLLNINELINLFFIIVSLKGTLCDHYIMPLGYNVHANSKCLQECSLIFLLLKFSLVLLEAEKQERKETEKWLWCVFVWSYKRKWQRNTEETNVWVCLCSFLFEQPTVMSHHPAILLSCLSHL